MSTEAKTPFIQDFVVASPNCRYGADFIESDYTYETTVVEPDAAASAYKVRQVAHKYVFRTERRVPKTGLLYIGLGGNNGSTLVAGILANKKKLSWNTKTGPRQADYYGSLTQCSTVRLGTTASGEQVYVPFNKVLPMVHPNDLVVHGWDISAMPLGDAMARACVLDYDIQRQLREEMNEIVPMPSIYYPSFIAANQSDRADNVLPGTDKHAHLETIRQNIRDFKAKHGLDKVIVAWVANTERFADVQAGLNDTAENLLASIKASAEEVSPSTIFAVASILEGCSFINGSPQNTFVPGVMELAERHRVFIGGDDLKTGQTKMKSVLVDYLVSAGLKPVSVVSYNHLGNNDGKNLSAPEQFRSKEISKSNVVDDMVASNRILFQEGEHPDHLVVIKYVPYVRDSKRALDEYTSEIFMGGTNTISMHNTCEDSLLAVPIILDLVILAELMERVTYKTQDMADFERTEPILSILSFLLKAPVVPRGSPVINSFFRQHECIVNFMRACVGLPPDNNLLLESKTKLKL